MCMLTKRTHILFEENLFKKLAQIARIQKKSVGQLIREAVREKYMENEKFAKRSKAIDSTLKHRTIFKKKINYKELINYGRKF